MTGLIGRIARLLPGRRDSLWLPDYQVVQLESGVDLDRMYPDRTPCAAPFAHMSRVRQGKACLLIADYRPEAIFVYRFGSERDCRYWMEQTAAVRQRDERGFDGGAPVPAVPIGPAPTRSGGDAKTPPRRDAP